MADLEGVWQARRDTAANWTTANPTLAQGELGFETDTRKAKLGDGVTAWTSLAYLYQLVSEKGQSNGYAPLDGNGDVPFVNLPGELATSDEVTTTVESMALLISSNLSDVNNAATAFANIKQAASATATGVVELATTAEIDTGTDTTRAITPQGLATSALKAKVDGIEAGADVTSTANVTAAGALMDSEVDADIKTLTLPAGTTISTFGASLVDDADAAEARTTLGALGTTQSINSQVGTTYTLVLTDENKLVTMTNASASTLTVPPNASVAFPVGARIDIVQRGAGQVTIAEGAGVTINVPASYTKAIAAQYGYASLEKIGSNEWDLVGFLDGGASEEIMIFPATPAGVPITATGATSFKLELPKGFTVSEVWATLDSACTTGTFTVDIHVAGLTVLSTKITIDATETNSRTAVTAPVLSDTSWAEDQLLTIEVDDAADGTGEGLKVFAVATRTT